jgi:uncharacterized oligopeptide transporter (OPT) family protein
MQSQENPDAPENERLYTPYEGEEGFTFRAVLTGCLLGGVVSCMNIYFGLKTGWSIGGSLIAAIMGFSIFAAIKPKNKYGVLEANITQTAGSAAGTMTSAAGLLACIPAMGMLGHELTYMQLTIWAASIAYLGVFFAVPLRRQMVLVEKLRFPTGTATAETIMAMFSSGEETLERSRTLVRWGIGAGIFTLAAFFIPQLGQPEPALWGIYVGVAFSALSIREWFKGNQSRAQFLVLLSIAGMLIGEHLPFGALAVAGGYGFSLLVNPLMMGAGVLIGPRVGASLFAGAVVSWGILAPVSQHYGWAPEGTMAYDGGARGWVLWPGVAIMVADALTNLALSWRSIVNTFKRGPDSDVQDSVEPIPNTWWMVGLGIASTATVLVADTYFQIPPHLTILAIALSAVLAMIAVRSTGETDINPIGGMGKVTQLVYGGIAPGAMTTNLMAAGITGAGASQAGDMMQDLKTGHLLGAQPKAQMKAQLIGIAAGILFCVPIYKLFDRVYEIGGDEMPAPAAHAWKAMAELLSQGLSALPPMAPWAVGIGFAVGVVFALLKKVKRIEKWLPSGMAFGVAFIVPAFYSVAMFAGAMIFLVWSRVNPVKSKSLGFSIASGLIAGEGLMGIIVALLQLAGLGPIS